MADQEFLASFAVDIDEAGVSNLQTILKEDKSLAEELSAAFDEASEAIRSFVAEVSKSLPSLFSASGNGNTTETLGSSGGLKLTLDTTDADRDLDSFLDTASEPVEIKANTSGLASAATTAWETIRSILSQPITVTANVNVQTNTGNDSDGDSNSGRQRMSSGGRFTRPTDVQVAEDGGTEYIIPVGKENRAVPLLRQLLSELSPAARESLTGGSASLPSAGLAAGTASAASVTQDNRTVSAPVNIHVNASGADPKAVGQSIYDTAERYLLRTLQSAL